MIWMILLGSIRNVNNVKVCMCLLWNAKGDVLKNAHAALFHTIKLNEGFGLSRSGIHFRDARIPISRMISANTDSLIFLRKKTAKQCCTLYREPSHLVHYNNIKAYVCHIYVFSIE